MSHKGKGGRATEYTKELAEIICTLIGTSNKGIDRICREYSHLPSPSTVFKWLIEQPEFSEMYTKAKKYQVEVLVDDCIEIADETSNDTIIRYDSEGHEKEICNSEWINRSRLRIDTRKWIAARLMPIKYGEKSEVTNNLIAMDYDDFKKNLNAETKPC